MIDNFTKIMEKGGEYYTCIRISNPEAACEATKECVSLVKELKDKGVTWEQFYKYFRTKVSEHSLESDQFLLIIKGLFISDLNALLEELKKD